MEKTTKPSSKLMALSAAAAALHGVAEPAAASAPTEATLSYRYSNYSESAIESDLVASGHAGRYDIKVNQFSALMPVAGKWAFAISLQDETLSGASPWHNAPAPAGGDQVDFSRPQVVMSGATPGYEDGNLVGIEEHRTDGSFGSTYYFDGGSLSGNVAFSTEDDYDSVSGGLSFEKEFDKKQTVVAAGVSYSDDSIFYEDATRVIKKNESHLLPDNAQKTNTSGFLSVSRILGANNIILGGVSFSSKEGHLSDAYKKYDKRPSEREAYTLSLSYRHYTKAIQGAWHFDYRYYDDNWGITSSTFSAALYKNWEKLQFVPSFRYYGQSAASFYDVFAMYRKDGIAADQNNGSTYAKWEYFSDDARLSDFGAMTFGFKMVFKQRPVDWVLGLEYYLADKEFLPGNSDQLSPPGLIEYTRFTFGVDHKF